jgi:hypothetical protein
MVTVMVLPSGPLAFWGVSVGVAHCVRPAVVAQACRIVAAMIAANTLSERVIFFITPIVVFLGVFRQACCSA